MTQPEPSLGDRVIADMERQLAEPDVRYARKCRELALVRGQYDELMAFVRSKADVLGLTEVKVGLDGQPVLPADEAAEGEGAKEDLSPPKAEAQVNGKVVR